MLVGE